MTTQLKNHISADVVDFIISDFISGTQTQWKAEFANVIQSLQVLENRIQYSDFDQEFIEQVRYIEGEIESFGMSDDTLSVMFRLYHNA